MKFIPSEYLNDLVKAEMINNDITLYIGRAKHLQTCQFRCGRKILAQEYVVWRDDDFWICVDCIEKRASSKTSDTPIANRLLLMIKRQRRLQELQELKRKET